MLEVEIWINYAGSLPLLLKKQKSKVLYVKGCLQVLSTSLQTILPLKDGPAKTVKEIWGAGKWSPRLGQKTTRHSRLEESSQPLQNMAVGIDVRREPSISMILHLSRFMLFSNTNVSRLTLRCCHSVSQHGLYTKHTIVNNAG